MLCLQASRFPLSASCTRVGSRSPSASFFDPKTLVFHEFRSGFQHQVRERSVAQRTRSLPAHRQTSRARPRQLLQVDSELASWLIVPTLWLGLSWTPLRGHHSGRSVIGTLLSAFAWLGAFFLDTVLGQSPTLSMLERRNRTLDLKKMRQIVFRTLYLPDF